MKGVNSTDGRQYFLELQRTTPRDANFVSKANGGTNNDKLDSIPHPSATDDDDFAMALLRPELLEQLLNRKLRGWQAKNEDVKKELLKEFSSKDEKEKERTLTDEETAKKKSIEESHAKVETTEITSIVEENKFNINVFYNLNIYDKANSETGDEPCERLKHIRE